LTSAKLPAKKILMKKFFCSYSFSLNKPILAP
jgi:hypothetical protein